ncbi:hypothetical protein As57867_018827, partial [Aphanomyces stellatus]
MEDESSSKAIRMNARKEVEQTEGNMFANSSRWIDSAEYERLANMVAREKEEEFRLSQPTMQLHKPKSKAWNPPMKVPMHKRKQPDIAVPEALKHVTPAPPSKSVAPSPRVMGHRTLKLRKSIDEREKRDAMDTLRAENKDLHAALVARFRHNVQASAESPAKPLSLDDVHTIEDAILYFLSEKHRKNVLYFRPQKLEPNMPYRPYDLVHVEPLSQNNKDEHFLMGATNLVHYKANEHAECIPVAEWVY